MRSIIMKHVVNFIMNRYYGGGEATEVIIEFNDKE
jgi:hypothetical protein